MVCDSFCNKYVLTIIDSVVATHDALQLGEFSDHVGQQIGFCQARSTYTQTHQLLFILSPHLYTCLNQAFCDGFCNSADSVHAIALCPQLVVINHFI